jgi:MFS family permease
MPPEQDLTEPLLSLADHQDEDNETFLVHSDDDRRPGLSLINDINNDINEETASSNPYKNHNVRLCLLLCAVSGVADSIWGTVVLSGFLYALAAAMGQTKEDNTLVGLAEMVQGISMLLCALPIGIWADRAGKAKVARIGGGLMLLTCAITMWALVVVDREAMENVGAAKQSYIIMLIALALWGIVSGISNGPIQALFADSIPQGKRSELLTWLYSCYLISSSVGPLFSIAMLSSSKAEDWSIAETFPVFFSWHHFGDPSSNINVFLL